MYYSEEISLFANASDRFSADTIQTCSCRNPRRDTRRNTNGFSDARRGVEPV